MLCNPTTFTVKVCKDLVDLVRVPENALRALCELYSAMSRLSSSSKALFLASKKMYFYAVWLNSELAQNHDLVEDILRALIMIIGGVHDRLGSDGDSGRPDKSKMQQIKMP